ncbi:MAG: hypothetical protein ACMVO3_18490 [Thalassobaculum sp.]
MQVIDRSGTARPITGITDRSGGPGPARRERVDYRPATVEEGKRRYTVRTEGDFESVQSVARRRPAIDGGSGHRPGRPVDRWRDIGEVVFDYKEPVARIRYVRRARHGHARSGGKPGANVIETMAGSPMPPCRNSPGSSCPNQKACTSSKVYDETDLHQPSAISLVQQNIWVGGLLAAVVLLTLPALRLGRRWWCRSPFLSR